MLLLSGIRSLLHDEDDFQDGHQRYAAFVPLATTLIHLIGQGPLKSVLRVGGQVPIRCPRSKSN
ncbi:MAG: hypothetical protein IPK16_01650 [Anaerolineales bacterium]|nr:hypothetical protein [Anaerolineales bacterium]